MRDQSQTGYALPGGQMSDWLVGLYTGSAVTFGQLSVVSLHSPRVVEREYLFLGEALAQGTFRITEISEQGSVPNLLAANRGDQPVLLIDGEELVGAKQNRVLNLTLLVPAHTELMIPVTCVEQGRWRYASTEFVEADRALFAAARAGKSRAVSESLKHGRRNADQGAVWQAVNQKLNDLRADSPTRALADAYVQRSQTLNEYVQALGGHAGECGAVFAIARVPVALEMFDNAEAFQMALPKLIRSLALDAAALPEADLEDTFDTAPARELLRRIGQMKPERYPALGLGEDLRVPATNGLTGGALLLHDRLVHTSIFDAAALERVLN